MAVRKSKKKDIAQKKTFPNMLFFVVCVISIFLFIFFIKGNQSNSGKSFNKDGYSGERGQEVFASGNQVLIDEKIVEDGNYHAFNFYSEKLKKSIYFFVVKASDGTYRAAANACEVCFEAKKGFKQVGNMIQCNNCGNTFTIDQIALEKGGCNPSPINKNVVVENNNLVIGIFDLEKVADLF